ncbi:hypothetical protein L1987_16400 [Smallanthus sonchifolius]|uniref:Uncharacterized protein n=1 Tax=Smallanthus sonchifolius TaxID=185202 RepID=A0ACB9J982_9ASTR|nr:hypothetical protein L1987_16400 [Smallanthus sonchifolius]
MAEVKLYASFVVVLYVFTTARLCYTDNGKLLSSRENVEVEKLLNSLNKPPVKSIKSPDGDIIDCVHISHQPAFDHPLLKNHTIKMRPSYDPNRINLDDVDVSSKMNTSKDGPLSSSITQLWHSNGKCPKGTIPIRRTKKQDVLRANSVESYGKKKKSFSFAQPSFIDDEQLDVGARHEYAFASTYGQFYGTKAALNLWNPRVQESNEFSLTQTWIAAGTYDSGLNTIEAGWQVYPRMYGDTNTRLFIYWTSDAYQKTGCYNLCSGFIQINNKIAIGGSVSATSQIDGSQHEITILIWKDGKGGDWWMQLDGELIGYWPSSLFSYLRGSASRVEWGGEVMNSGSQGRHTTTQMGSGQFPKLWFRKASYVRKVEIVDGSNTLRTPIINTNNKPSCYDILSNVTNDNYWGTHFFFGGPGRNKDCP